MKMIPAFTCLYFLENTNLFIVEIKRMDLDSDAAVKDRFKWLRIEKETLQISALDFNAMDSAGEIEERFFEQGYLKFNATDGTYIEKYNSAQHPLYHRKDFFISSQLKNAITEFLRM